MNGNRNYDQNGLQRAGRGDSSQKSAPKFNFQAPTPGPISTSGWVGSNHHSLNGGGGGAGGFKIKAQLPQIIPDTNQLGGGGGGSQSARLTDGVFRKPVDFPPQAYTARLGATGMTSNLAVAHYKPLKEEHGMDPHCMSSVHTSQQQVPSNTPAHGYRSAPRISNNMEYQLRGPTPTHSDMSSFNTPRVQLHHSARHNSNYLQPPPASIMKENSWSAYKVLPDVGINRMACMHDHHGMQSSSAHLSELHQNDLSVPHPRGNKRARSTSSQSSDFDIVSMIRYSPSALKPANFAGSTRGSSINSSPQMNNPFLGSMGHLGVRAAAMGYDQPMNDRRVNNYMMQHSIEEQENNPFAVYQEMGALERRMSTGHETGMTNSMVITQPDPHSFNQADHMFTAGASTQQQQQHSNMNVVQYKQESYDEYSQPINNMSNLMVANQNHFNNDNSHSPYSQQMSPYNAPTHDTTSGIDQPSGNGGIEIKQEPLEDETQPEEHKCDWVDCNIIFAERSELVQHLEKQHIDQRRGEDWTCFWGGCTRAKKPFNARYKLLIHMRVHSGERPNKCTFEGCDKAFSRLENLKIHLRSHTGERPYQCQYENCSKAFSNSSDRAKHQRTHIDMKPYACTFDGCTKRYTDPSSLRKHVKSHLSSNQQLRKKPCRDSNNMLGQCMTVQNLKNQPGESDPPAKPYQSGMHFGKALSYTAAPPPPQLPSHLAPDNKPYTTNGGFNPAAYKGSLLVPKNMSGQGQQTGNLHTQVLHGTRVPMVGDTMRPPPPYPEQQHDPSWQNQPELPSIHEGSMHEGPVAAPSPMDRSPGPLPHEYHDSPPVRQYFSSELNDYGPHNIQLTRAPPRSFVPQEGNAPLQQDYTSMPCHLQVNQVTSHHQLGYSLDETLRNLPFDTVQFQRAVSNHSGS